ncbi:fasciclin domain-containing protein [Paucihalobacter sp.]|uniref:fasciclin domain-containing protein n=1 Tax=Paucihalobacter sp. TaxID=2850405 RepID=UPI003D161B09
MKLKMNRVLKTLMCVMLIALTGCNDGKKEEQIKAEQERIEMEAAEKEKIALQEKEAADKKMAMENSIASKAMNTESLSTLVAALKAADLATMMSEPGIYTVFAPTNDAFSKLPTGTLDNLLKPENKETLQNILKYHVVAGKVTATDLTAQIENNKGTYSFKTVAGEEITATVKNGKVMLIDGRGKMSEVTATDIDASNGVVHLINAVVMAKQ